MCFVKIRDMPTLQQAGYSQVRYLKYHYFKSNVLKRILSIKKLISIILPDNVYLPVEFTSKSK